jgi:hypothetical protein
MSNQNVSSKVQSYYSNLTKTECGSTGSPASSFHFKVSVVHCVQHTCYEGWGAGVSDWCLSCPQTLAVHSAWGERSPINLGGDCGFKICFLATEQCFSNRLKTFWGCRWLCR